MAPVIASALAIGFLTTPLFVRVNGCYFTICFIVLAFEALVGFLGFALHLHAVLNAVGRNLFKKAVHGAPIFAPLLFPNLAVLGGIGLWIFRAKCATSPTDQRVRGFGLAN